MENLIKLKLADEAKNASKSKRVMDTFIESCKQLDASIFEPLIDEDQMFQDQDKNRFLTELKLRFDSYKARGIEQMELKLATCDGCHKGHITHEFHADGMFQFAYILQMKGDILVDIFRCNKSTNDWMDHMITRMKASRKSAD